MSELEQISENLSVSEICKDLIETENFTLLGDKTLYKEGKEINVEIFYKYNREEKELDLMLKDVSRTKWNEQKSAEFKYKTVFLSKIAHEFKNPIVSMCELVNQSQDNLDELNERSMMNVKNSLQKNFDQIKSLSDFLIILVKDLNYFSELNLDKNIKIEEKETNLEEVLNFMSQITKSLMDRSNKSKFVNFKIELESEVPKTLKTDEWRLKQILVNLLSNAIKFTLNGQILLKISLEKSVKRMVKFLVQDTGVGIKKSDEIKLFTPFQKGSHVNNEIGSGLGLFLSREIAAKLGTGLNYVTTEGKGSSFWFSIPVDEEPLVIENNPGTSNPQIMIFSPQSSDELNETNKKEEFLLTKIGIMSSDINLVSQYDEDDSFDYEDKIFSKGLVLPRRKESYSFSIMSDVKF